MATIKEFVQYDYEANTQKFTSNVDKAKSSNDGFMASLSSGKTAILGWAGAISGAVIAVIKLGQMTTEQVGIQNQIVAAFGDSTDAAVAYAEQISGMLAIPTQDMLRYSALVSLTAENYGFAGEAADVYGIAVAQLSATIASYLGLPVADVAERISAAMRGEAESAEVLGLSLNETAVSNYAMANGAQTAWKDMSDQEKMTWRLYTAIDQVATMMGVEVGQINSTESALEALTAMTDVASTQTTNFQKVTAELKNGLNDLLTTLQPIIDAFFGFVMIFIAINQAIFTYLQPALSALGEALGALWVTLQPIITVLGQIFGVLTAISVVIINGVIIAITNLINWLNQAIQWFINWFNSSAAVQAILDLIANVLESIIYFIGSAIAKVQLITSSFKAWADQSVVLQKILEAIQWAIDGISNAIATLINWVNGAIEAFQNFFGSIGQNIQGIFDGTASLVSTIEPSSFVTPFANGGEILGSNSITKTQNNIFNISAKNIMTMRDAYRSAQVNKRGGFKW